MKYLLLLAVSAVMYAQETQVYEEFKVSIHQMHVNVTDKDGNPVRDLKQEDFVVKLNGKAQEVVSAYPVSISYDVDGADAPHKIPESARRLFLFMFDTQYTHPSGLIQAREDTMDFVMNEMKSKDLASIFTMNGNTLRLVCNFTSDKAQLSHALETFGFGTAKALHKTTGYVLSGNLRDENGVSAKEAFSRLSRKLIEDKEYLSLNLPGPYDMPVLYTRESMRHSKEESKRGDMMSYLNQFDALGKYLGVIRGQKNLVLFSGGFTDATLVMGQETRGTDFVDGVRDSDNFAAGNVLSSVRNLVEALQGSATVVFTVDTSKVKGSSQQKASLHVLNDISSSTGGRVFTNTDKFDDALRQIKSITNDYYLVNIQTDLDLPRGELARVKVQVNRPKVRVYASKGLLLKPDYENLSPMERKLMLTDFIGRDLTAGAIPVSLEKFELPWRNDTTRLHIQLEVAGEYLLNSSAPHKPVTLDVTTALMDLEGNIMIDQNYGSFTIVPQKAQAVLEKSGIMYLANLFAKPGQYKMKVVVRNLMNGHTTSMIQELDVKGQFPDVMGPFAANQTPWVVIREEDLIPNEERMPLEYPFQIGDKRFLPTRESNLSSANVNELLYLYNKDKYGNVNPNIAAIIVDEAGEFKVAPPEAMKSLAHNSEQAPTSGILFSLDTTLMELEAGSPYTLLTRITLGDAAPVRSDFPFKAVNH